MAAVGHPGRWLTNQPLPLAASRSVQEEARQDANACSENRPVLVFTGSSVVVVF